jgi:hypothetical protein
MKNLILNILLLLIFILAACNSKVNNCNKLIDAYNEATIYRDNFSIEAEKADTKKADSALFIKTIDSLQIQMANNISKIKAIVVPDDLKIIKQNCITSDSALSASAEMFKKMHTTKFSSMEEIQKMGAELLKRAKFSTETDSLMNLTLDAYVKANNIKKEK